MKKLSKTTLKNFLMNILNINLVQYITSNYFYNNQFLSKNTDIFIEFSPYLISSRKNYKNISEKSLRKFYKKSLRYIFNDNFLFKPYSLAALLNLNQNSFAQYVYVTNYELNFLQYYLYYYKYLNRSHNWRPILSKYTYFKLINDNSYKLIDSYELNLLEAIMENLEIINIKKIGDMVKIFKKYLVFLKPERVHKLFRIILKQNRIKLIKIKEIIDLILEFEEKEKFKNNNLRYNQIELNPYDFTLIINSIYYYTQIENQEDLNYSNQIFLKIFKIYNFVDKLKNFLLCDYYCIKMDYQIMFNLELTFSLNNPTNIICDLVNLEYNTFKKDSLFIQNLHHKNINLILEYFLNLVENKKISINHQFGYGQITLVMAAANLKANDFFIKILEFPELNLNLKSKHSFTALHFSLRGDFNIFANIEIDTVNNLENFASFDLLVENKGKEIKGKLDMVLIMIIFSFADKNKIIYVMKRLKNETNLEFDREGLEYIRERMEILKRNGEISLEMEEELEEILR